MEFIANKSGLLSEQLKLSESIANDLVSRDLITSDISLQADGSTAVENIIESEAVVVFPNPSNDFMKIEFDSAIADQIKHLDFYNQMGQLLYSLETDSESHIINKSDLQNGLILMVVKTENTNTMHRLVFTD